MHFRFHIKNRKGKFIITIAYDWGHYGGPTSRDYIDMDKTAFAYLLPFNVFHFDEDIQAQNALRDFKAWLKTREHNWIDLRRKGVRMAFL